MKIVFFSGGMNRSGGTERVLSEISNGLYSRGYEVVVVSLTGEHKSFYKLNDGITTYWIDAPSFTKGIFSSLKKLKKIIAVEKPDIWIDVDIILCFYSLIIRGFFKHRFKLISWEHFNHNSEFEQNTKLRALAKRIIVKKSDGFVVLSQDDFDYYSTKYKMRALFKKINNPTPFANVSESANKEKMIFAAGNLVRVKGFDRLIAAWGLLEKKFPDWRVEIAGSGVEEKSLRKQIEDLQLKNIQLIGRVEDIREKYSAASIYALTSHCEGFPMVLLEAMSYAVPIVAFSDKTCASEMIEDGVNGYLIPGNDVSSFAAKLEAIMSDCENNQKMSEKAKIMSERFSKTKIICEWENFLKKVNDR